MSKPILPRSNRAAAIVTLLLAGLTCAEGAGADASLAVNGPVRGVVRPMAQATMSSDLQAQVAKTNFKEGDRFKKGDVLIEFDCRRYQAELDAAEAQALEARLGLENNVTLDKYKAVGRADLEVSKAKLMKGEAEARGLRARLDQCKITAPFDGRISELFIQTHETPSVGKPLLTVIEDQSLEIELIAPSDWLKWLVAGTRFSFTVDETGTQLAARVTRIGAAVDPVSQTIKIMAAFDTDAASAGILSGMSGSAEFQQPRG